MFNACESGLLSCNAESKRDSYQALKSGGKPAFLTVIGYVDSVLAAESNQPVSVGKGGLPPLSAITAYFPNVSTIAWATCSTAAEMMSSPFDLALTLTCLVSALEPSAFFALTSRVSSSFALTLPETLAAV